MDYTAKAKTTGITMECPVRLGLKRNASSMWTFPLEPKVSVKGAKTIVRRNIAKAAGVGTVKEQWNMDDWEITIEGIFISSEADKYPEADVSKLKSFLKPGQSIVIRCKLLEVLGIDLLCIQDWDFPATDGKENQEFSIRGYSDQDFDLIVV